MHLYKTGGQLPSMVTMVTSSKHVYTVLVEYNITITYIRVFFKRSGIHIFGKTQVNTPFRTPLN